MTIKSAHPDAVLLARYNEGDLEPEQFHEVESHILSCDSCCEKLQDLPGDSFIERLRALASSDQASENVQADPHEKTVPMADDGEASTSHSEPSQFTVQSPPETRRKTKPATEEWLRTELSHHSRYDIKGVCGQGGMGAVYRATHRLMEREVALKVINLEMMDRPEAIERFHREVKAAARLSHPNIVAAYDAEQVGGVHLFVMEYVDGQNLAEAVRHRERPFSVAEACDFIRQAALGLQHAHAQGMVHRDIKPQNLMLTREGTVKILDFGLASLIADEIEEEIAGDTDTLAASKTARLTHASTTIGTPDYIAPEQIRDARDADIRADIYGLGCTLYFLLTGRPPFPEGSAMDKIKAHAEREPRPIAELRDDVPPALGEVLQRMMAKNPSDRFQTPEEVAEALAPFRHSIEPPETPKTEPAASRSSSNRRWGLMIVAVLIPLLLLAAIIYIKTDNGTIAIETDDPDVRVVVEQNGKQVTILDGKTNQQATLDTGEYSLRLGGEGAGFELDLPEGEPFYLKRGEDKIVTVRGVDEISPRFEKPKPNFAPDLAGEPDYETLGDGPWTRFEIPKFSEDTTNANYKNGVLTLNDRGLNFENLIARDLIVRAKVRRISAANVSLNLRQQEDGQNYNGLIKVSHRAMIGRHLEGRWTNLGAKSLDKSDNEFVELAFAALGDRLLLYADGELVLEARDDRLKAGFVSFNAYGGIGEFKDLEYRILDARPQPMELINRFPGHRTAVMGLAAYSDGEKALSVDILGGAILWDLESGEQIWRHQAKDYLEAAAMTSDGSLAAVAGGSQKVVLLDASKGQIVGELDRGLGDVRTVRFSPDGNLVAAGGWHGGTIHLWNTKNHNLVRTLTEGQAESVEDLVFTPDGKFLVAGGEAAALRVFEVSTGKLVHSFATEVKRVEDLAISYDGKLLISGGGKNDGIARIWNLSSGESVQEIAAGSGIGGVGFLAEGRFAATADFEGRLSLWDVATSRLVARTETDRHATSRLTTVSNETVLTGGGFQFNDRGNLRYTGDYALRLWRLPDAASAKKIGEATLVRKFEGHELGIFDVAFSRDGEQAVSCSADGTARFWEVESGNEVRQFKPAFHPLGARSVAVAPDREFIVVGSGGGQVNLLFHETNDAAPQFTAHSSAVAHLAFSPDGKQILTCDWDSVSLRSVGGKRIYLPLGELKGGISAVFSPDGKEILTAGKPVRRYDSATGGLIDTIDLGEVTTYVAVYSPDGNKIACGLRTGDIALIDTTGGKRNMLRGHTDCVRDLEFTRDGRHLISGSTDGTLRVWNLQSSSEVLRQQSADRIFNRLALSPDGRHLLTGGGWKSDAQKSQDDWKGDYALRLWTLPESFWPDSNPASEKVKAAGSEKERDTSPEARFAAVSRASFALTVPAGRTELHRGESDTVAVRIDREDSFAEPIRLEFSVSDDGLEVVGIPTVIAPNQKDVEFRVKAKADAMTGEYTLRIIARPKQGKPVTAGLAISVVASNSNDPQGASVLPKKSDLTPRQIIDKGILAHGGREKLNQLLTARRIWKGELDPYVGKEGYDGQLRGSEWTETWRMPDQIHRHAEVAMGKVRPVQVDVLNGKQAWQHQESPGIFGMSEDTDKLDDRARAELREQFHALDLLRLATIDENTHLAAVEDIQINGNPAAGVLIKDKKSPALKLYFDRRTGLLVKKEQQDMLLESKIELFQEVFYEDYEEIDGLQHPRKVISKHDGKLSGKAELAKLELNPKIDENQFANPRRTLVINNSEMGKPERLAEFRGQMPYLERLNLGDVVNITDEHLREVAKMTRLKELVLDNTELTATQLKILAPLKQLELLNLSKNALGSKGLENLSAFPHLKHLNLTACGLNHEAISKLSDCDFGRLEELYLQINPVSDDGLASLPELPALKRLFIRYTDITAAGLMELKAPQVEWIIRGVEFSESDDWLKAIGRFPHLTGSLVLHDSPITDEGLAAVGHLTGINHVDLRKTHVTDAGIKNLSGMTGLERLQLSHTQCSDAGLRSLGTIKNLGMLHLNQTQVTGVGFEALRDLNLGWIEVVDCPLTTEGIRELSWISSISHLKLSSSEKMLTADDLRLLHKLPNLRVLSLEQARLAEDALSGLTKFPVLESLSLNASNVTHNHLKHLPALPALEDVSFERTAMTDEGLAPLANLPQLKWIGVEQSRVTDLGYKELVRRRGKDMEISDPDRKHGPAPPEQEAVCALWRMGAQVGLSEKNENRAVGVLFGPTHYDYKKAPGSWARRELAAEQLRPLEGLPQATRLHLHLHRLTPDAWQVLVGLKQVKELSFVCAPIADADLVHMARMTQLEKLSLAETPIEGPGLAELEPLTNLESLDLDGCRFQTKGLTYLPNLPALKRLDLRKAKFDGADLAGLAELPALESLILYGTPIRDEHLPHLRKFSSLTFLDLRKTEITAEGARQLQQWLPDCSINRPAKARIPKATNQDK